MSEIVKKETGMKIIGIIPARMGSSRFPGKPLADIAGVPMIGHVYFRSRMSRMLDDVYIATCDAEIMEYAEKIGKGVMTSPTHERASDRAAEAIEHIENSTGVRADIVVMIQGDEPMITPEMIDSAIEPFLNDKDLKVVNLMAEITDQNDFADPNEVKVVVDMNNNALYFSREPVPSGKKCSSSFKVRSYKQVCVIPFRRDYLTEFNNLSSGPLEITESVDMLRVLEHGGRVKMVPVTHTTFSVDTEGDLRRVEEIMIEQDKLMKHYMENE